MLKITLVDLGIVQERWISAAPWVTQMKQPDDIKSRCITYLSTDLQTHWNSLRTMYISPSVGYSSEMI